MNYDVFSRMEDGTLTPNPEETEQTFMERVLRDVFAPCDGNPTTINDMLSPRFVECSAERKSLCAEFAVEDWMHNPNGSLHGGLLSTSVDIAVGVLARYHKQTRRMVTVNLYINYLSGVPADSKYRVRATVDRVGRRMVFARADVYVAETGKQAATASAVFM